VFLLQDEHGLRKGSWRVSVCLNLSGRRKQQVRLHYAQSAVTVIACMVLWSVGQWVFSDFCVEVTSSTNQLTDLSSSGCWSYRLALPSHLALTWTNSVILQLKAASSYEMSEMHIRCVNNILTTPAISFLCRKKRRYCCHGWYTCWPSL